MFCNHVPITSLYPGAGESNDPLLGLVLLRRGAGTGRSDHSAWTGYDPACFSGGARLFDAKFNPADVRIFAPAGERIWINITGVIRHPIGNRDIQRLLVLSNQAPRKLLDLLQMIRAWEQAQAN